MSLEGEMVSRYAEARGRLMGAQPKPVRLSRLELPQEVVEALPEPEVTIPAHTPSEPTDRPKPTAEELAAITDNEDLIWRVGVKQILIGFGENLRRLTSHQRDVHIMDCRKAVATYLRQRGWSYPRIGAFMNRDHSSIINMVKPEARRAKYERERDAAAAVYAAVDDTADCTFAVFGADGWRLIERPASDEPAEA